MTPAFAHPGRALWTEWFEPLGLTVGQAARALGVTRVTLSRLINGRQGISAEMSIRLGKAFNLAPAYWLEKQMTYDLASLDARALKINRLVSAATTAATLAASTEGTIR